MPKVTIDGKEINAPVGANVIQAARQAGIKIPHYCYHSKLSVAGNCRICMVEIEKNPKLQIGCNTVVQEGMVVKTNSPKVLEARQSVLEFILVNHPIDCPVCDQAGECKLQEYYMKHDLRVSRMDEEKVHKEKAISLGPYVKLDMERCILCSRCIRFCQEIAHADELCFTERGDHTELTTYPGKPLSNPYSVNTVDICPVGALTSADFRFQQRVWFLKSTDSVCPGCATGCNVTIDHNKGVVYRLRPRENPQVNDGWMCDEGRLTYKPVNDENRLRSPFAKRNGGLEIVPMTEAVDRFCRLLREADPSSVVGIGSAEFANEDNEALISCLKGIGVRNFYFHAKEVPHPSQDSFLISPDKNPNRAGVTGLGMRPFPIDRRYRLFVILGGLPEQQIREASLDRDRRVILLATHRRPEFEYADLIFPVAAWAESDGTFTNKKGMRQEIHAAFPPRGEGKMARDIFGEIQKKWSS